jgi:hypothetical protein
MVAAGFPVNASYDGTYVRDMTPLEAGDAMHDLLNEPAWRDQTDRDHPRAKAVYQALSLRAAGALPSGATIGAPPAPPVSPVEPPPGVMDWTAPVELGAIMPEEAIPRFDPDASLVVRALGSRLNLGAEEMHQVMTAVWDATKRSASQPMSQAEVEDKLGPGRRIDFHAAREVLAHVRRQVDPLTWEKIADTVHEVGNDPTFLSTVAAFGRQRGWTRY